MIRLVIIPVEESTGKNLQGIHHVRWLVCDESDLFVYARFDTQAEAQAYWEKAQA